MTNKRSAISLKLKMCFRYYLKAVVVQQALLWTMALVAEQLM